MYNINNANKLAAKQDDSIIIISLSTNAMLGYKRFFNSLKDKVKRKRNNNSEINFRNLLRLIWPQLFSILPK